MTIKFAVANRVENLTEKGPMIGIVLMSCTGNDPEEMKDAIPAKLEIGNLNPDQAKNFPLGRILEINIPTYSNSRNSGIIVPGMPGMPG